MEATFKASLKTDIFKSFMAIEVVFPGFTLRLVDAGFVTIGGELYTAEDATYGRLGGIGSIQDGGDDVATRCEITILPASAEAMDALTDPEAQVVARVRVFFGTVNPATGECIGVPDEPFIGFIDVADFLIGEGANGWAVIWDCATGQDRALEAREGQNLSPAFHESIWAGELGLRLVDGVTRKVYWGTGEPAGNITGGGGVGGRSDPRPVVWSLY